MKSLPQVQGEDRLRKLVAGIEHATYQVYVEILPTECAANSAGYLTRLLETEPLEIFRPITENR